MFNIPMGDFASRPDSNGVSGPTWLKPLLRTTFFNPCKIRTSSYHDVIRVSEVSRFIDITFMQTYMINRHKIMFLNGRPQLRHGKGVTKTCEICGRNIADSFCFYSLGCKLGGINRDPRLPSALQPKDGREQFHGSDSHEWPGTKKLRMHTI